MWDDLPKRTSSSAKILITITLILVLGAFGYVGYLLYKNAYPSSNKTSSIPTPEENTKNSDSPNISPSSNVSPSVSLSASPSASANLHIPDGETLVLSSPADTNGDGKEEILVVTQMANNKYHAYVLSNTSQIIFENKELSQKPVRIATQTYDPSKESFLSWMMVFTEQSGNLAFIHWNGTKYEIPQENSGI